MSLHSTVLCEGVCRIKPDEPIFWAEEIGFPTSSWSWAILLLLGHHHISKTTQDDPVLAAASNGTGSLRLMIRRQVDGWGPSIGSLSV